MTIPLICHDECCVIVHRGYREAVERIWRMTHFLGPCKTHSTCSSHNRQCEDEYRLAIQHGTRHQCPEMVQDCGVVVCTSVRWPRPVLSQQSLGSKSSGAFTNNKHQRRFPRNHVKWGAVALVASAASLSACYCASSPPSQLTRPHCSLTHSGA
jgi:hypothetical protein